MSNYIYLSHFLDEGTILYGGERSIVIKKNRDIDCGDTANTKIVTFNNHSGTHIDFPNHFFSTGLKSDDYDANFWIFNHPHLIELECPADIIITPDMLLDQIPANTDIILLKTGFERFRGLDIYWENNPGLSPELSTFFRAKCPNLRVIGMDFISITSYQNRALGKIAHKFFLGDNLLLIEDMHLSNLSQTPSKVICLPLMMKGLDGAPINVIAKI